MQLQTYLRIIWRRGWIMLALAIITAVSAFAFSKIMEERAPVYKATIRILVEPARTDFGQAQAAKTLLRSYVAWMQSRYRAEGVIDRLDLDMVPDQLMNDVTIASDDSRLVIQIDVENANPAIATDIAREWANLFVEYRQEQNAEARREDRIEAEIIDEPSTGLDRPNWKINTLAGGIMGLLVGMAIVFVLEYLGAGVIRSADDVSRFLDMPILGAIPSSE